MVGGSDLDQHSRCLDRRPGPRLQKPDPDPDQRPPRRHGERVEAVDRGRRADRDRSGSLIGGLRQPEHGRRDQHNPEDGPHRARHFRRSGYGLVEPAAGPIAAWRGAREFRLLPRRPGRDAVQLQRRRRVGRIQYCMEPRRWLGRLRLRLRRQQSGRRTGAHGRHIRRGLPRFERQPLLDRPFAIQPVDRCHL